MAHRPGSTLFKPAGIPARELVRVEIHLDELEAIRLVDAEELDHAAAAAQMNVSRATVGRILARGRGKIARGLTEGHALHIECGEAPIEHVAATSSRTGAKPSVKPAGSGSGGR